MATLRCSSGVEAQVGAVGDVEGTFGAPEKEAVSVVDGWKRSSRTALLRVLAIF